MNEWNQMANYISTQLYHEITKAGIDIANKKRYSLIFNYGLSFSYFYSNNDGAS